MTLSASSGTRSGPCPRSMAMPPSKWLILGPGFARLRDEQMQKFIGGYRDERNSVVVLRREGGIGGPNQPGPNLAVPSLSFVGLLSSVAEGLSTAIRAGWAQLN